MMPATAPVRERVAAEQAAEAMVERYGECPAGEEPEARRARQRWIRRCLDLKRGFLIAAQVGDERAARAVRDDTDGRDAARDHEEAEA